MSVKAKERTIQLPKLETRAEFSPSSFNKEKRTIELVWSVGAKGLRGYYDQYYEELSMDPACIRMGRLESGATPFVDAHASYSNQAVLGVVESARIEGGKGIATVRLCDPATLENQDAKDTITKIETGILKNVSVGYNVYRYERQPAVEGEEIPTFLAVDWEPVEISIVPVGFDQSAAVRGKSATETVPCVFSNKIPMERGEEIPEMTDAEKQKMEQERAANEKAAADKAAAERKEAIDKARSEERARQGEIRSICTKMGLDAKFAEEMASSDHSLDKVRELVIEAKAKQSEDVSVRNANGGVTGGKPAQLEERKAGLENALLHRADPSTVKLTEGGRDFRGMSLMEVARDFLSAGGVSTRGLGKMEIATRAFNSSSDFSNVLANVANKSLRKGYDEAPRTFTGWAKQGQLPDFKQVSRTQLGEAPQLEKVGENGEIKKGTIGDGAEKYQLATFAKIMGITRNVIINDDLGAFTNVPAKFGYAASSLESDLVYSILTANAAMADGVALFHATHKNLGTAAAPSVAALGELRKLMRQQTGLDKKRILNIMAKFLIVPASLETAAEQLLTAIMANTVGSVNPFVNKLQLVVEPRLDSASATAYFTAADPSQIDTVEYAYLDGQAGVYSETRMGFEMDGIEFKARLDFAAKAIDHRGLSKNAGV